MYRMYYSIRCLLYTVHKQCTLYTVQYTLYNIYCSMELVGLYIVILLHGTGKPLVLALAIKGALSTCKNDLIALARVIS